MIKISDHFIESAKKITKLGTGSVITPKRLVLHYTAGSSLKGAIDALEARELSYNVLIDKDGSLHQARALNRRSLHAGRSNFKAVSGLENGASLNTSSISISFVNLGFHEHFSGGFWWYTRKNGELRPPKVKDVEANKLAPIYSPGNVMHWEPYTDAQISTCEELIEAIMTEYPGIEEIVGHDDISIFGKFDPGPDLPVQAWREKFGKEGGLGLESQVNSPDGTLNLRERPSYLGGKVIKVLSQGDRVFVRSVSYTRGTSSAALVNVSKGRALTGWASVDIDGSNKHHGFVYMGYLTKTPLAPAYADKLMQGAAMF